MGSLDSLGLQAKGIELETFSLVSGQRYSCCRLLQISRAVGTVLKFADHGAIYAVGTLLMIGLALAIKYCAIKHHESGQRFVKPLIERKKQS